MSITCPDLKPIVAAILAALWFSLPLAAQDAPDVDALFDRLKTADAVDAARIERQIRMEWAQSGSPAMDLLLKRGQDAAEKEDYAAAFEHFSALTDHAPGFAEGWHARAQVLARSGKLGPALADLNRTLALNPRHFGAIYGLGTIFEQVDRPDQAFDAYMLVLKLHPHHEEARERLKRLERGVNGFEL